MYCHTACVYALTQDVAHACEWLEKAVVLDESSREDARKDTDFDGIREAVCFQELVGEPESDGAEPPS